MNVPLLTTKLYIPALRSGLMPRPRLIERLNEGVRSAKMTLISAPAGFGKTTLLSEWIHCGGRVIPPSHPTGGMTLPLQFAWLSLDAGDNDPTRFWTYVIAALQTVYPGVGQSAMAAPQPRSLPVEMLLTGLINEEECDMEGSLEARNVVSRASQGSLLLRAVLAVLLFSVFLKLDSVLQLGNTLAARGWSMPLILLAMVLVRTILAGVVVLTVLPVLLGFGRLREWLPTLLRIDLKIVLLGILSFAMFCILAAAISLAMGIWKGDLATAFARPDLRPDPDVIGWGYFLLALIPGIWEELAFRGLIQSKLRGRFSSTASVLLSATFFALFHFSNLVTQPPAAVIGGVIMAFFFGIAWGIITDRSGSVLPGMLAHYLVDSMGQIFLNVEGSNPALATGFFLLLTLTFPVVNILLARVIYRETAPAA